MKSRMPRMVVLLRAVAAAGAAGLALSATMAAAQGEPKPKGAAASKPATVPGVVVQAPRRRAGLSKIPPDKAAAFDEEAAKDRAWQRYRKSTPPAAAGTLGQGKDYPGLHTLLPH